MGKNNRAKRAAKAKQRQSRGTPRSRGEGRYANGEDVGPIFTQHERMSALWWMIGRSAHGSGGEVPRLAEQLSQTPAVADLTGEQTLLDQLDLLWAHGWQPAELRRQARLAGSATSARLIELAILADASRRADQPVHEAWAAQLADLGQRQVSLQGSWLKTWRQRESLDRVESYRHAALALASIAYLPPLDVLLPPPGADPMAAYAGVVGRGTEDPVLRRVRKLLSKAESTEYADEAAALSAKAQQLMTRHAIDQAMVTGVQVHGPRMIRVPIDAPYADAKSLLLAMVAEASRCRAIYLEQLAMSSVIGGEGDLPSVEILFTSLLVQAQRALAEAARSAPAGTRVRSQSYRSSFYLAFARRIDERLGEANHEVFAEAAADSATFLPVLRAQEDALELFIQQRYGDNLEASQIRNGYDYAGWEHGRRAADQAALDSGELLW